VIADFQLFGSHFSYELNWKTIKISYQFSFLKILLRMSVFLKELKCYKISFLRFITHSSSWNLCCIATISPRFLKNTSTT